MSLHALAGHMSAKGRGPDSMLVHMTPQEVASLQALAVKNGTSLTINPDTGLPEAFKLKDLLPAIAGIALGPAGFGLMSGTMAGLTVGGITTLATGSLSRGLMAGMGAYGASGLAEGLMGAGAGAAQGAAMSGLTQEQIAQQIAEKGLTEQGVLNQAAADASSKYAASGFGDRLAQGASAAMDNPKAFMQGMGGVGKTAQLGLAAIAPIMADQGVQTTTKMPSTGTIRRFSYDPYSQTYTSQGSYPAAEEERKASGGIVALAEGGGLALPEGWGVAGGKYDDPNEKIAYFNQNNITADQLLAANQGVTQKDIDWMVGQGYSPFNPAPGSNKYVQNVSDYFTNNPNATYADIQKTAEGLNPADVQAAMAKAGLSGAAQFAAFNQNIGDTRNVDETYSGLKGLSSNINYWINTHPGASLNDFRNEMTKWELNEDDIRRATGKTSTDLFTGKITTVANPAEGASGGTGAGAVGGGTVVNPNGTITTSPVIPGIPVGGFTGVQQVKDAYTTGGGSLGYANAAPTTMAEFNTRFGNQTGDSKAAYDFLMGKGANSNAYPVKPSVGEYMRPYNEATLGVPARAGNPTRKYIYDPTTRAYKENRDYVPITYDSTGKRITGESLNAIDKKAADDAAAKKAADDAAAKLVVTNATKAATESGAPANWDEAAYLAMYPDVAKELATGQSVFGTGPVQYSSGYGHYLKYGKAQGWAPTYKDTAKAAAGGQVKRMALGGLGALAGGGSTSQYNLGGYSDGGRLLRGPGDGVSDSIPATIGNKQPARLADGEFVIPARIVSELGNGSTEAGARKLYAMMDRVQKARGKTTGKSRVAANTRAEKYLPA